jgi:hypothetical protein
MTDNPDSTWKVFVFGIGTVYIGSDQGEVDRMKRKYQDLLKMKVTVEHYRRSAGE